MRSRYVYHSVIKLVEFSYNGILHVRVVARSNRPHFELYVFINYFAAVVKHEIAVVQRTVGDITAAIAADTAGKNIGFTKNCFDLANITVTAAISLLLTQRLVGVGIGTVAAVLGVGRIIALYHRICGRQIRILAGMEAPGLSR